MSDLRRGHARKARIGDATLTGGFVLVAILFLFLQGERMHWRNPDAIHWLGAGLSVLAWVALVATLQVRQRALNRDRDALMAMASTEAVAIDAAAPQESVRCKVHVIHASQTGFAEQLAARTLQSLRDGGISAQSRCMDMLDLGALRAMECVIFIVSTTGEGDPPDVAVRFERVVMHGPADLGHLRVGLLALGDSDYEDFCGFGRALWHWLQAGGVRPLFDPVEADRGDPAALRHWQHHLARLSGSGDLPDWESPQYQAWTLVERRRLNPGSLGNACFHLALQPRERGSSWQAGDLVEIGPCHDTATVAAWLDQSAFSGQTTVISGGEVSSLASLLERSRLPSAEESAGLDAQALVAILRPLPHREYSIASIPDDGALHLLVREMFGVDGPGIGSAWLCRHAPIGTAIALRVRSNPNFHPPADARPLILIGNGTGMSALRSLIKARVTVGHHRNWLLFGERQVDRDFYYRDEIEAWLRDGGLERADFAWSRDGSGRVYVQQRLREEAAGLIRWLDDGATIHVCGSLEGMAPGVDDVLRDVLGAARVEELREQGRYRRDVY